MGALLRPDTPAALKAHRWVRLTTFACSVPYSPKTLQKWARAGKLPASHRFGHEWWVDLRALRELRRQGSEHLIDDEEDDEAA